MKLIVNGQSHEVNASLLAAALDELGFGEARVATAVNGIFVAEPKRAVTRLNDGDAIEILAPRAGG